MSRFSVSAMTVLALGLGLAAFGPASDAAAHAFGKRYDLPLPLWLWVAGAGAAVALSFVVSAVFLKHGGARGPEVSVRLSPWAGRAVRAVSLFLFFLVLAACFFGNPETLDNFAPTFVWVIWWVGFAFIAALFGNIWDAANPWAALFGYAHAWAGRPAPRMAYPGGLGHWPAVALFITFAWMELVADAGEDPRALGPLILVYSAITWTGMAVFGRDVWLRHGEVFHNVFWLLARFAPFEGSDGRLRLRLPSTGLVTEQPASLSQTVFILVLLTSVTFDGILETPAWRDWLVWLNETRLLHGPLEEIGSRGINVLRVVKSFALVALPAVIVLVYGLFAWLTARAGGGGVSGLRAAGWFAFSLVPIAIAYHLSHYYSYLMIAGQNMAPLLSDPFGFGWDLFGTAAIRPDFTLVKAKTVWFLSVTAIVAGHVAAVYLAHETALKIFPGRRRALISQIPMMILMIGYTMISLWVLSQPIVSSGAGMNM
ncbi:MAG: hypothetical protein VW268_12145 [Rhodospirillaceae bacterium]